MEWKDSVTRENLLRAFAGESQARNRYTFAAATARKKGLHLIEAIFLYTADQERAHAKVFYSHLQKGGCDSGIITGAGYPVDLTEDVTELLELACAHETEEWDDVYPAFAQKAEEEGYEAAARHFRQIAEVEKVHADRFRQFAAQLREGKLFVDDVETGWICLNCGHVLKGLQAPERCPVCDHSRGYFIRMELSPLQR